ncbi:MAG: squalene synthase HpnC [Jatrophihabitantaceae bacterium]
MDDDGGSGVDALSADDAAVLTDLASRAAAQRGAENFPVALRVLPRGPREHLRRVYNFARFVDDVGDEAPGDRLALLDAIEADVRALWGATAVLPPVAGLRPVLDECAIPIEALLDLIEANRVDQRESGYETFADLVRYCRLSAAPVGRLVLHVAGRASPANIADSDPVCAALQVLEHCQDVGEDARAGRLYLPATDLRAAGVALPDLLATSTGPPVRSVVATQVARARDLLQAGHPLVRRLRGWSRIAVAGYLAGGIATADALERADFDVLAHAIRPSRPRTAMHLGRLLLGAFARSPAEVRRPW